MKKKTFTGRIIILLVIIAGIAAAGLYYYNYKNLNVSIEESDLIEPIHSTIEKRIETKGTVQASNYTNCHAYVSAKVLESEFEVGDYVSEGDKIFVLDTSEIERDIKKQENAVESAIYSRKQTEGYEWEIKRIDVENAQSALDDLNAQLSNYEIIAPHSGIITERKFGKNDYVNKNEIVATIADVSKYLINVEVYEDSIKNLKMGQEAYIEIPSISYKTTGTIKRINPIGKAENGITYYTVSVEINNVEDKNLFLGMNAKVQFTEDVHKNVLVIPAYLIDDNKRVFVITDAKTGAGEYKVVEIGISDGEMVEILSGLNEGDKILINPEKYAGIIK